MSDSTRGFTWLHRGSAVVLALILWGFGALGLVNRLSWFDTSGPLVLGLSSNRLLSVISLVVGAVLIVAAWRGGRTASTTSVTIGALFLLSGVLNSVLVNTEFNPLGFRMPNVVFSLVAGLLLLVLGAYGRFTGRLPDDSPYRRRTATGGPVDAEHGPDAGRTGPARHGDADAARALAEAERAVAAGGGTDRQRHVLSRVDAERDPERRLALWRRLTAG